MNYDIIIIGAGLGGLIAGAKLAKSDKKVLVLEQHFKPGGCATIFKRKDFIVIPVSTSMSNTISSKTKSTTTLIT